MKALFLVRPLLWFAKLGFFVGAFFAFSFFFSSPSHAHPYGHNPQASIGSFTVTCVAANTANATGSWGISDAVEALVTVEIYPGGQQQVIWQQWNPGNPTTVGISTSPGVSVAFWVQPKADDGQMGSPVAAWSSMPDCRVPDPPSLSLTYDCNGPNSSGRLIVNYTSGARTNSTQLVRIPDMVDLGTYPGGSSQVTSTGVVSDGSVSYHIDGNDYGTWGSSGWVSSNSVSPDCRPEPPSLSLSYDCGDPGFRPRLYLAYTTGARTTGIRLVRNPDGGYDAVHGAGSATVTTNNVIGDGSVGYYFGGQAQGPYGNAAWVNSNTVYPNCLPQAASLSLSYDCGDTGYRPRLYIAYTTGARTTGIRLVRSDGQFDATYSPGSGTIVTYNANGTGGVGYYFAGQAQNGSGSTWSYSNTIYPNCLPLAPVVTIGWDCSGPGNTARVYGSYAPNSDPNHRTVAIYVARSDGGDPGWMPTLSGSVGPQNLGWYGNGSYGYYYYAYGNNSNGNGAYGYSATIYPDCRPPGITASVSLTTDCVVNTSRINVNWGAWDGLSSYYVVVRERMSPPPAGVDSSGVVSAPTTTYRDTTVIEDVYYRYYVQPYRWVWNGSVWILLTSGPYVSPTIQTKDCTPECISPGSTTLPGSYIHQGGQATFQDAYLSETTGLVATWIWNITRVGTSVSSGSTNNGRYFWSPIPNLNGTYVIGMTYVYLNGTTHVCPTPQQVTVSDFFIKTGGISGSTYGDVHANGPIDPGAVSLFNLYGQNNAEGLVTSGGNSGFNFNNFRSARGQVSQENLSQHGTLAIPNDNNTGYSFSFFDRKLDSIAINAGNTQLVVNGGPFGSIAGIALDNNKVYKVNGNLDISDPNAFRNSAGGARLVILVTGNLSININFANGGGNRSYYTFIVQGNVNIHQDVTQIDAFILSNGSINTGTRNGIAVNNFDPVLTVNGSLISYGTLNFQRQVPSGVGEVINYDPGFVITQPVLMGVNQSRWQEVAP